MISWTGSADVFPTREAVVDDRGRITFAELKGRVERLAAGLMRLGIKQGECVLLQLSNLGRIRLLVFALQKIGAIPVLLILGYKQLEVGHLGKLTEATAWIVPTSYRKIDYGSFLGEVRSFNPQLKQVISARASGSAPGFSSLEALIEMPITEDEREELAGEGRIPHLVWPISYLREGPRACRRAYPGAITITFVMSNTCIGDREMNAGDVALVVVPVGHNLALLNVVGSILFGYKLVLLDSTKPVDICATIEAEKVTYMPMVPSLVRRILEQPELGTYSLASLKKISAVREPSTPELIRDVYKKLNCTYINEFGMSEGLLCQDKPYRRCRDDLYHGRESPAARTTRYKSWIRTGAR